MAYCLFGTNPLTGTMQTYCQLYLVKFLSTLLLCEKLNLKSNLQNVSQHHNRSIPVINTRKRYNVGHSKLDGVSPVDAASTISSFTTVSVDWAMTTARQYEKHMDFGIWCVLY